MPSIIFDVENLHVPCARAYRNTHTETEMCACVKFYTKKSKILTFTVSETGPKFSSYLCGMITKPSNMLPSTELDGQTCSVEVSAVLKPSKAHKFALGFLQIQRKMEVKNNDLLFITI